VGATVVLGPNLEERCHDDRRSRRKVMARFQLTAATVIGPRRLKAGTVICDGTSCQTGDFIWTGLTSATMHEHMTPLDSGATTMKAASRYASVAADTSITGVASIDA